MMGFNDRESGPVSDATPVAQPVRRQAEPPTYGDAQLPPPPGGRSAAPPQGAYGQSQYGGGSGQGPSYGQIPGSDGQQVGDGAVSGQGGGRGMGGGQQGMARGRFLAAFSENLQEAGVPQDKVQEIAGKVIQIRQLPQDQRKQAFAQMFPDQDERAIVGKALRDTRQELGGGATGQPQSGSAPDAAGGYPPGGQSGGQRAMQRDRFLAAFAANLQEAGVSQEKAQEFSAKLIQIRQVPQDQRKQAFAQMFPDQHDRAVVGRALQETKRELGGGRQRGGAGGGQQPASQQEE